MSASAPLGAGIVRRTRRRERSFGLSAGRRQEIADRVVDLYHRDLAARSAETDARLQRIAKYRQWRGGESDWPWPGSSNQAVPDMLEASIRMQDTLHNAVMSARPVVVARALQKDKVRQERAVDALHDTQLFLEQDGERLVEQAAEEFVNEPAVTFFTSWVTERREVIDVRTFPPIPDEQVPRLYFATILRQAFPEHSVLSLDPEGWDWRIEREAERREVGFYTKRPLGESETGDVEMVVRGEPIVYDGPRVLVKGYDDVLCPPRCANLDIPGPSNPGGAAHVILRDFPTKDEILRLARSREGRPAFYDLVDKADREKLLGVAASPGDQESSDQRDRIQGMTDDAPRDPHQQGLTRLLCFDTFDIDDDGQAEDVVFWVLLETKQLLRARPLTEVYPGPRPERPLASSSFLPVGGRRAGISLLETIEGLHDFLKETIDQMVDNGTLANLPWGTYRAASSLKPEMLRPGPGDLIPTNDPRNDIVMQSFRSDGQAFWMNLVALIRQQMERLTLQGDIQAGRVPAGGSSALRTLGGIQTLLSQGEARPERILRRFFMALARVFRHMHRLNRYFLPDQKKFRAADRILAHGEDPWFTVATADVDVDLEFDFHANVQNSSKAALQQGLQQLAAIYLSPLTIQLGLVGPAETFRLLRDLGQAFGQDPGPYLREPSPGAGESPVEASEAMLALSRGVFPDGPPLEGATAHLAKLQELIGEDLFGAFPPEHLATLRTYLARIGAAAQTEQQLQAQADAATPLGQPPGVARGTPGRPPTQPVGTPTQPALQGGEELLDETLPGAGGGSVQ